eukprot:3489698-Pleurochrysis_carterae.AAC.1
MAEVGMETREERRGVRSSQGRRGATGFGEGAKPTSAGASSSISRARLLVRLCPRSNFAEIRVRSTGAAFTLGGCAFASLDRALSLLTDSLVFEA